MREGEVVGAGRWNLVFPLVVLGLLLTCGIVAESAAAAECTDVWTGSSGSWSSAELWSAGHAPTTGDVACVPTETAVVIESGAAIAHVLQGAGKVTIESGSLALTAGGTSTASNIGTLRLDGGELKGEGTLFVTSSLIGDGGAMKGIGTTVVGTEATATVSDPEGESHAGLRLLASHLLQNRGTVHVNGPAATLSVLEGSTLENEAALELLGSEAALREQEAHIVNVGELHGEGAESELHAEGGIVSNSAQLAFLPEGSKITAGEGAEVDNSGTLSVDGAGEEDGLVAGSGESPSLVNTGSVRKGSGAYVSFVSYTVDNRGLIEAAGGEFAFVAGGVSGGAESTWGDGYEEGKIVFADGVYDLGTLVRLQGQVRILNAATVVAEQFEAWGSTLYDEEGGLELVGTEGATHFGRLELLGAELEVPAGGEAGAEYLAVAEGRLTVAGTGRWGKGYVDEVGGEIEIDSGGSFEAGYIEKVEGRITTGPSSRFAAEYVDQHAGPVEIGANSSFAVASGWLQQGGSLSIGPGTSFVGETDYWRLEEGTQTFGAEVDPDIYFFQQEHGEVSFGHSGNIRIADWYHRGGLAAVAPGSTVSDQYLEQTGDTLELGAGTRLEDAGWMGIGGGELKAGGGSEISGLVSGLSGGTLELEGSSVFTLTSNLAIEGGHLSGSGDTQSASLSITAGEMGGSGTSSVSEATWIEAGATEPALKERMLVTTGHVQFDSGSLAMGHGAVWRTGAAFEANSESEVTGGQIHGLEGSGPAPRMVNTGDVVKTRGEGTTTIAVAFENFGRVGELEGHLVLAQPVSVFPTEHVGAECVCVDPVDIQTGDLSEQQTDLDIPGWGPPLLLQRTYSAAAAAEAGSPGPFGYGWTMGYGERLLLGEAGKVTARFGSGATIPFTETAPGTYSAPAWSQDTLSGSTEAGFTLTLPGHTRYLFAGSGALHAIVDRNGNQTTVEYGESGNLERLVDPAGRVITLTYNEAGEVASAEDPMGHVVTYAYEGGELKSVTMPGESTPRWRFSYDGSHRLTVMTDGRGGETINEYDNSNRLVSQTDPAGRTTTFAYRAFRTTVTNESTGAVTEESFTTYDEPTEIVEGAGTESARTQLFTYDEESGRMLTEENGDGDTTHYEYNPAGDRIKSIDPDGDETSWTYNAAHELTSETTPEGETTTIARDEHGNVESISRPAPGGTTQVANYEYDGRGKPIAMIDPMGGTWEYRYDEDGNGSAEINPEGDKATFAYNGDSDLTSVVSPRGNAPGATPSEFETQLVRDPQGRLEEEVDPTGSSRRLEYDGDGNVVAAIDPLGNEATYSYNADDQLTEVEEPNGDTEKTSYDGDGAIATQTDGNGQTTTFVRNVLGEAVEVIDPLGRRTHNEFDGAGNLAHSMDPSERQVEYVHDPAGRLTVINYSNEATPDVTLGYDEDGNLTEMADGTGTNTYEYDQLGRLTQMKTGAGSTVEYGYDLGNHVTSITYPNGKEVGRTFDPVGRLKSVTDWLGGKTEFGYDPDSDLTDVEFPTSTPSADTYEYNRDDRMVGARLAQNPEPLARLEFPREAAGRVESEAQTGLPGPTSRSFAYDEDGRLIEAGAESFGYDGAGNVTSANGETWEYDAAAQLESGPETGFEFDPEGDRTKMEPAGGPATSYEFDQSGELRSLRRPESGEVAGLEEEFTYSGSGLMASRVGGESTKLLTWDTTTENPLLLAEGNTSFVYGPMGLPLEQISASGNVLYLHHDQLGSTRLATDEKGEEVSKFSYGAYGEVLGGAGSAVTPLLYAGQYTVAGGELQYLRARFYEPATYQFISRDPLWSITRQPYAYAFDNPITNVDPSGLCGFGSFSEAVDCVNPVSEGNIVHEGAEAAWHFGTTHTIGFCVGGAVSAGVGAHGQVCVQGNLHSVGATATGGAGVSLGLRAELNAGVAVSNAEQVCELTGPFTEVDLSGGEGPSGSGTAAVGTTSGGREIQQGEGTVGFGIGEPVRGGVSVSETWGVEVAW
jgi:RHS repeat-associated protein